jgi:hypothetical protein
VRLLGRNEVTTIDEPDYLQFVLVRENGWIDLVGPPVALLVFVAWAVIYQHYFFIAFAVIGLFALIANYANGSITKLFVSQSELIARGNLDRALTDEVKVKVSDIESLDYRMGGRNSPSGFYASQGWLKQTCLLPGLSKQKANAIADAICERFPNIKR